MKTSSELAPIEVRRAGWKALKEKLGPDGALKFMLDYDLGEGNYTEERKKLFDEKSVDELVRDMKRDGYA